MRPLPATARRAYYDMLREYADGRRSEPPDVNGEPAPEVSPLASAVRTLRGEMGRDMDGTPLAAERFAILDEERIRRPWVRALVRTLWLAEDDEEAQYRMERREAERLKGRGRGGR